MNKKSETALEWFFYGEEFELWKLQTKEDYMFFFGMVAVCIIVMVAAVRIYNSQRNTEKAKERTCRRLSRLAKKPQVLLKDVTLKLPEGEQTFDAVLMDKSGVYLVKVFGWGLKVFGIPDGEKWRLEDRKKTEEVENPLIELNKGVAGIKAVLEEQGISRVKVQPLVVFADNYSTPELYLGYGSCSTTYQELKTWYAKNGGVKDVQYDFNRVSSILSKSIK